MDAELETLDPPIEVDLLDSDETLEMTLSGPDEVIIFELGTRLEVDPYDESYEITPRAEEQVIPTTMKVLEGDIVVKEIPYYETSNEFGITVYIG